MLDKEAREYTAKVRQKDAKVAEVRERQRLMAKIADKDGILGQFGRKKVVGKSKSHRTPAIYFTLFKQV